MNSTAPGMRKRMTANLKSLLKKIQKCENGDVKDALYEVYEILEWFYNWLENLAESVSDT